MAMPEDDPRAPLRREEGALAEFFDAARAERDRAEAPPRLMAAMLADAAAVHAPETRPAARPGPRPIGRGSPAWRRSLGGRAAAIALAACFALGAIAGVLGAGAGMVDPVLWPDDAVATSASADMSGGIDGFFDLALAEG